MSKFDWMKRAREATTIAEVRDVMNEIAQAYANNELTEDTYEQIFGVCFDKLQDLQQTAYKIMEQNITVAIKAMMDYYTEDEDISMEQLADMLFDDVTTSNFVEDQYTDDQVNEAIDIVKDEWIMNKIRSEIF